MCVGVCVGGKASLCIATGLPTHTTTAEEGGSRVMLSETEVTAAAECIQRGFLIWRIKLNSV